MRQPEHYTKLIDAAKSKDKTELEIYQCISNTLEKILDTDPERDKTLLIKALMAYTDGKSSNSWYTSIIQIPYAIVIGVVGVLYSLGWVGKYEMTILILALLVVAIVCLLSARNDVDFKKKIVLCVLTDKLENIAKIQSDTSVADNKSIVSNVKPRKNTTKRKRSEHR